MPAHSAVKKPVAEHPPQQIICPEIGDRLWYVHAPGVAPMLLIVSAVHSEHSVTGVSVDPQGWVMARQRVYLKQLPGEHPEPPYCIWPERKPRS